MFPEESIKKILEQMQSEEQNANEPVPMDDGVPQGSIESNSGANELMQPRQNRPSDDNQRHSNKAESIEVVINSFDRARDEYVPQQALQPGAAIEAIQQVNNQEEPAFEAAIFRQKSDEQMVDEGGLDHPSSNDFPDSYYASLNGGDAPQSYLLMGPTDRNDACQNFDAEYQQYANEGQHGGEMVEHTGHDVVVDCIGGPGGPDGAGGSGFVGDVQPLFPEEVIPGQDPVALNDQAQNDKRFYTLVEIAEMEPSFEQKYYDSDNKNGSSTHVILSPQEYRAKLYWLDQENRWKDIGTGRFRLLLSKDGEEHYIQVVSEDCIDDQMQLDDVDKVVDSVIGSDNAQSPNSSNHHMSAQNTAKQVFLHRCFVNCLHEFSRQGDTIITWSDDYKNEFALSFQDEKGAQNTWWSICFLKGIQISANLDEHNEAGGSSESNSITGSGVVLPTKENLTDLVNDLYSTDAYVRRNIAEAVLRQEENIQRVTNGSSELSDRDHSKLQTWRSLYLDKLQKIFNEVEQQYQKATKAMKENEGDEHDRCIHMQQQVNHLHSLFQIFRNLLNLNQSELLEVLLNENYWMTTFGALEYDPEVFSPLGYKYGDGSQAGGHSPVGSHKMPNQSLESSPNSMARSYGNYDHFEQNNHFGSLLAKEADFREFLSKQVKFKQAVEITDPQVTYSIHLSYKLQYLKDTAMARFIDENTSHTIMQLVSQLHNTILDYIFGDDFERIQAQLIAQMRDNTNVQSKENALKFFLEICSLLKSTNLTNRQLQNCTNAFTKIMKVLAQIFDIMIPDKHTLLAEVKGDTQQLIGIYEARNKEDQERATLARTRVNQLKEGSADGAPSQQEIQDAVPGPEESKDSSVAVPLPDTPDKAATLDGAVMSPINEEFAGPSTPAEAIALVANVDQQDCTINPGRATLEEYLKNPLHSEDPSMTQIDILKSNSIEIFYNLLILLNNVNHSTIRDFLCSEHQKKHNFVFLRHLAQHMMYSSQQGIKVSICEFLKDLTSKETTEMQKNFQMVILNQVVALFVEFLGQDDPADGELMQQPHDADHEMKDEEELKSQGSKQALEPHVAVAYRKKLDQSRILILQFMNKLIQDNVDSYALRTFFFAHKVLLKVANCSLHNSIQTNVEVVKFFKAIIQTKDNISVKYMINKQVFDTILEIFLNNKKKGNLLHSCILNLFEMLTPQDQSAQSMLVIDLDKGYGAPPTKTSEGGYVQANLLDRLYKRLHENKYVKRVFFNKAYEDGFRKFNRYLRSTLDIHCSEQDSKQLSDRDRSNSQSQHRFMAPALSSAAGAAYLDSEPNYRTAQMVEYNDQGDPMHDNHDYEDELDRVCFGGEIVAANNRQSVSPQQQGHKEGGLGAVIDLNSSSSSANLRPERKSSPSSSEGHDSANSGNNRSGLLGEEEKQRATRKQISEDVIMNMNEQPGQDGAEPEEQNDGNKIVGLQRARSGGDQPALSNRAARSISPMSGHAATGAFRLQEQPHNTDLKSKGDVPTTLAGFIKSLDGDAHHTIAFSRPRKLSQEDLGVKSGNPKNNVSKNLLTLSEEANGSNKGANKSSFSDSMSNPDLDDYFFNKQNPTGQQSGFSFQIQAASSSPGQRLQRQSSPGEAGPLSQPHEEPTLNAPVLPFKRSSQTKKPTAISRPKYDRGRRASSENPPPRTELTKLTDEGALGENNNDFDKQQQQQQDAELQQLLDMKVVQEMPQEHQKQIIHRRRSLEMSRNDSIGYGVVGQKRQRESKQKDDSSDELEFFVKENWEKKRPRLSDKQKGLDDPKIVVDQAQEGGMMGEADGHAEKQDSSELARLLDVSIAKDKSSEE